MVSEVWAPLVGPIAFEPMTTQIVMKGAFNREWFLPHKRGKERGEEGAYPLQEHNPSDQKRSL